jgi:enediyne biosynthesis protein E4
MRPFAPLSFFALAGLALAQPAPAPIAFEEIAARSGLSFVTNNCPTPNKNQPETMVSGVALFDYDGDGFLDVYFTNGADIPSLQKDDPKYNNRLFRNNRNGTFTDVTDKAGVSGKGYGLAVAIGDYDNDGHPDLFLASVTANQLFHNNGDGTFTDVTEQSRLAGGILNGLKMWSASAAWFDYNKDGRLDLFVSNYCKWEVNKDPVCVSGKNSQRGYCDPRRYDPLPNQLYRNNGDGTFTDVSAETGIAKHYGKGMGAAIADYDGDGWIDVFVANDNSPNFLFRNLAGKRFEEVALAAGVAFTDQGMAVSGMGADFRDVNNDGLPDIWHTAIENETFPLYLNAGKGQFTEVTGRSGVAQHTINMSGWSNFIADLDNDGWKDLFVARSNVLDNSQELSNRSYPEPNALFRNLAHSQDPGGPLPNGRGSAPSRAREQAAAANKREDTPGALKFQNVSATAGPAFQLAAPHRGAAFGDLDNDGRLDMVVSVLGGRAKLFRNVTADSNHWISLQLTGTKSNRMGIGAQLRLTAGDGRVQYNQVTTSTGFACSSDVRAHFGLGSAKSVRELQIIWPSGVRQVLTDLPVDRIIPVKEP